MSVGGMVVVGLLGAVGVTARSSRRAIGEVHGRWWHLPRAKLPRVRLPVEQVVDGRLLLLAVVAQEDLLEAGRATVQHDRAGLLHGGQQGFETLGADVAGEGVGVDRQVVDEFVVDESGDGSRGRGADLHPGEVAQFGQSAGLKSAATADQGDAVGDGFDLAHDVARQQHGAAGVTDFGDTLAVGLRHQRVEAIGGLVEHVEGDIGGERDDQSDLLPVALGVVADLDGGVEVETFDQVVAVDRVDLAHAQQQVDGLAAGEVGPQLDVPGHVGDVAMQRDGVLPGVQVHDGQHALVALDQPHEDAQECGLAGAVGPKEPVDLAGGHFEFELVQGFGAAEVLAHAAGGDHAVGHGDRLGGAPNSVGRSGPP